MSIVNLLMSIGLIVLVAGAFCLGWFLRSLKKGK